MRRQLTSPFLPAVILTASLALAPVWARGSAPEGTVGVFLLAPAVPIGFTVTQNCGIGDVCIGNVRVTSGSPSDNQILKYDAATGQLEFEADTVATSGEYDLNGENLIVDVDGDSTINDGAGDEIVFTVNGTESEKFNDTEAVFNESGADRDLRVEGATEPNAFFVQGSDGAVGLGTNNPQARIEALGEGAADPASSWFSDATFGISFLDDQTQTAQLTAFAGSTAGQRPMVFLRRSDGTLDSPTTVADTDWLGSVIASGYDGDSFEQGASINFEVDGSVSNGTVPTSIFFETGDSFGDRAERFRIDPDGNYYFDGETTQLSPTEINRLDGLSDAIATASSTTTFTNKTFDANGTGNSLSNVDVADLADGTDGELITWDSAGSAATVGAGTSGQVLTSNGAGAAPTFQDQDAFLEDIAALTDPGADRLLGWDDGTPNEVAWFTAGGGLGFSAASLIVDIEGQTEDTTPSETASVITEDSGTYRRHALSDLPYSMLLCVGTQWVGSGDTDYAGPGSADDTFEDNTFGPMPFAGTVRNLHVGTNGDDPGAGNTLTATVRKNGSDGTVTCTISDTSTSCSDTSNSDTFAAGDTFNLSYAQSASGSTNGLNACVEYVKDQ